MTRKEEIEQAAEQYYNKVKYLSDLSAFPIPAFKAGAEWADKTMIDMGENIRTKQCEIIFSELRESEDERIRKALIKAVTSIKNGESPWFVSDKETCDKVLAWLENVKTPFINNTDNSFICDIKNIIDEAPGVLQTDKNRLIAWLEKQGESKFEQCIQEGDNIVTNEDGTHFNISQLERVAKKEPKFKVGDFIVSDYCMGKVIALTDDAYLLDTEQGIPFSCEHNAHLWTIQDAKDGDVLVASDGSIFIFKEVDYHSCKHYVALTTDGVVKLNEGLEHCWENSTAVHPATKEQCDLLFQKIHEAGYKWNAEKKKLGKRVIDEGKSEMDYCFTKMMNGEKVSSVWSKDDEDYLLDVNFAINDCFDKGYAEELRNWLKSLKDRMKGGQL
jgi:hypothetical protein